MPFTQRTSKMNPTDMWMNPAWYSNANEYWNDTDTGHPWGLPNCTCYVWGRLLELGATNLTLCKGNAGSYYTYGDGYQRTQTPVQGAVACWYCSGSTGYGHVAIVEEVIQSANDLKIVISDSDYVRIANKTIKDNVYYNSHYFGRTTLSYPFDFTGSAGLYSFQGFIIVPITGVITPTTYNWISGNRYLTRSERDNNALCFYSYMISQSVTYNAVVGMLANIEMESGINPGIWESLVVEGGGYGLVQWTPYTKYSDWAGSGWEDNGNKECDRILYEAQQGLQWFANPYATYHGYPNTPPISLSDYMLSNLDYKTLADYWLLYYEHPAEGNLYDRISLNEYWTEYFNQLILDRPTPIAPPNPPVYRRKTRVSMIVNKRKFMRKRGTPWR